MKTGKSRTFCVNVSGEYALFTDPVNKVGGEKCSYPYPTYEALKGIMKSIFWRPSILWHIDAVRIMNPIEMETFGKHLQAYDGKRNLAYYTYLRDCRYKILAHYEINENRPEFVEDVSFRKYNDMFRRYLARGGRCGVVLGTRDCPAYVVPSKFLEDEGYYDHTGTIDGDIMFHSFTYPDEAYSDDTRDCVTINLWKPVMENGIIRFCRPEDCIHKFGHNAQMKDFVADASAKKSA